MVEQLDGAVRRIRFSNPETHWTVASVDLGRGRPITVVGSLPGLSEGMEVKLDGAWVDDPRWGRQFRAERYREVVPATVEGIVAYLASGFIPGIGEGMAQRIVTRFGVDTLEVIAADPSRLREVPGLGAKRVASLEEAFAQRRGAQETLIFLHGLGIGSAMVSRIFRRYGEDAVATIRRNPWQLAEDVHGIGFRKADQVAQHLEVPADHPARIRAGCLHVLTVAQGDGHCFLPRSILVREASALLGADVPAVEAALTALAMDGKIRWEQAMGQLEEEAVYPALLHEAELQVRSHLSRLWGARPADARLDARLEAAERAVDVTMAPAQRAALRTALTHGASVVTGGPGTGKTTIIRALIEASALPAHRVALAAPTGRAAKRMAEATGREARTIHRLLEFSSKEGCFRRDQDDPLDADLVIIDESSMIDLPLFTCLIAAIPTGAVVVWVGDVDQLPPVGPGSPLTDLIRSGVVPVARLDTVFRQGEGSAIVENAHRINAGDVPRPTPPGTPLQDFYFIGREDPEDILSTMTLLVTRRIPDRFGFNPVDDIQLLSPMRSGLLGVNNLNLHLQGLLNPTGPELVVGGRTFREGDKVMQIRNDYDRNVFNGDLGRIHRVHGRDRRLQVLMDGRLVVYEKETLDELVLAYAISVHKAQGSEYPAVVLPISTQHFKMLQRNLVYTGITRGKRLVVLVGTSRAMGIAVRNHHIAHRHTLLAHRLRSATGESS